MSNSYINNFQISTISIRQNGGRLTPVPVQTGKAIYILGRNGSGKSALVHNIVSQLHSAVYIPGSRPSYFDNDSLQLTPATRRQMQDNWASWDRQPQTRYRPIHGTQRNEKAILDLQSSETQFKVDAANDIKAFGGSSSAIARLQSELSPFDQVNSLMRQANLPTQIVMQNGEMFCQRGSGSYSIAKMSDGERSALLIAADIVSAPAGSIFVIDEPELHLHRSIVTPLISSLIRERSDCAFVVSTHELELPDWDNNDIIVLVRSCSWSGDHVNWWDVDVIPAANGVPDDLRIDLLGSRRKILFVEGEGTSLDQPFYSLLFPNASVVAKSTARNVREAVKALRNIQSLHHAQAYGLIDNDTLTPEQIQSYESDGTFCLPIASIESLYYSHECLTAIAKQQASTLGLNAADLLGSAYAAALTTLKNSDYIRHLAVRVTEQNLRNSLLAQMPSRESITKDNPSNIQISIESPMENEINRITMLVNNNDIDSIIARYPVRESQILSSLASTLRFRSKQDYERAVLTKISSCENLRTALLSKLGHLSEILQ